MKEFGLGLIAAISLTSAGMAADLPMKAAPPMVLPFNWTGAYIGAHGGYGWTTTDGLDAKGGFGGGQIGYNFQTGNFVFGIEADIAGGDISQDFGFGVSFTSEALASLRGRAGFAFDNWLFYGTAGGGWAHNKVSIGFISSDVWQSGWTAGAGAEWAFAPKWSAKFEYLHYGLGSENFFGFIPSGNIDINTVKLGINYHF